MLDADSLPGHCCAFILAKLSQNAVAALIAWTVLQLDQRFQNAVGLIRNGTFGWEDFFEPLVESITTGGDYYLLANDFPAYVDCQVRMPTTSSMAGASGFSLC